MQKTISTEKILKTLAKQVGDPTRQLSKIWCESFDTYIVLWVTDGATAIRVQFDHYSETILHPSTTEVSRWAFPVSAYGVHTDTMDTADLHRLEAIKKHFDNTEKPAQTSAHLDTTLVLKVLTLIKALLPKAFVSVDMAAQLNGVVKVTTLPFTKHETWSRNMSIEAIICPIRRDE